MSPGGCKKDFGQKNSGLIFRSLKENVNQVHCKRQGWEASTFLVLSGGDFLAKFAARSHIQDPYSLQFRNGSSRPNQRKLGLRTFGEGVHNRVRGNPVEKALNRGFAKVPDSFPKSSWTFSSGFPEQLLSKKIADVHTCTRTHHAHPSVARCCPPPRSVCQSCVWDWVSFGLWALTSFLKQVHSMTCSSWDDLLSLSI